MKRLSIILAVCFCCIVTGINAQQKFPSIDKSPMDVSYYPANYPVLKIKGQATEPLLSRVLYSRPQKNGREIFGKLIEYGKVWRLGANEATEIDIFSGLKIGDQKIKEGRYTMYAIPNTDKWTIIFNKETDTWGAFKYDESKDVLRVDAPVQKLTEPVEALSMMFEKSTIGFNLVIAWDDTKVLIPVSL